MVDAPQPRDRLSVRTDGAEKPPARGGRGAGRGCVPPRLSFRPERREPRRGRTARHASRARPRARAPRARAGRAGSVGSLGALRLASEAPPFANSAITYGYDKLGRLAARGVGGDGETFGYDQIGRLTAHQGDLGTFTLGYLGETGQLASRGNTIVGTTWTYDDNLHDRKLIAVANTPNASVYQFPNNAPEGAIGTIVDAFRKQTWTLGYDQEDRLLAATPATGAGYRYTLDGADNITQIVRPAGTATPVPNALNQVASLNGTAFGYDANGNRTGDISRTYAWDAENRLVHIGLNTGGAGFTLGYDGLGRRVAIVTDGGAAIRFGWCGSSLCQQRSGADVPTRRYLAEGEAGLTDTTRLYYSVDQLGSVRDALDATSGRSAAHFDYDWYGERLGSRMTVATDFRFAGLFLHQPSGLDLSATRAYDPATGTWLSRDPIGEAGGVNLYAYVGGNPVSRFDPLGLCDPTGQGDLNSEVQGLIASAQAAIAGALAGLGGDGGAAGDIVLAAAAIDPETGLPYAAEGRQPPAIIPVPGELPSGGLGGNPIDPNKLNHIFGNPGHNLDPLVQQFGSQADAYSAIENAITPCHPSVSAGRP